MFVVCDVTGSRWRLLFVVVVLGAEGPVAVTPPVLAANAPAAYASETVKLQTTPTIQRNRTTTSSVGLRG
jgi:hypothetical protein